MSYHSVSRSSLGPAYHSGDMNNSSMDTLRLPLPRSSTSSGSTRALQEMYRQSQGSAFFSAFPGPQVVDQSRLQPSGSYASLRSARPKSGLRSELYNNASMESLSVPGTRLSSAATIRSFRSTRSQTAATDHQTAMLAGLDLTDAWGFSWASSSPYDALLPPPTSTSRRSSCVSSASGSFVNLPNMAANGSRSSSPPSVRSHSPFLSSDVSTPQLSPSTSAATSATSVSSMSLPLQPPARAEKPRNVDTQDLFPVHSAPEPVHRRAADHQSTHLPPGARHDPSSRPISPEYQSEGRLRSTSSGGQSMRLSSAKKGSAKAQKETSPLSESQTTLRKSKSAKFFSIFRSSKGSVRQQPEKDTSMTQAPTTTKAPSQMPIDRQATVRKQQATLPRPTTPTSSLSPPPQPVQKASVLPLNLPPRQQQQSSIRAVSNSRVSNIDSSLPKTDLPQSPVKEGNGDLSMNQPSLSAPAPPVRTGIISHSVQRSPSRPESPGTIISSSGSTASVGQTRSRPVSPPSTSQSIPANLAPQFAADHRRLDHAISFKAVKRNQWSSLPPSPASTIFKNQVDAGQTASIHSTGESQTNTPSTNSLTNSEEPSTAATTPAPPSRELPQPPEDVYEAQILALPDFNDVALQGAEVSPQSWPASASSVSFTNANRQSASRLSVYHDAHSNAASPEKETFDSRQHHRRESCPFPAAPPASPDFGSKSSSRMAVSQSDGCLDRSAQVQTVTVSLTSVVGKGLPPLPGMIAEEERLRHASDSSTFSWVPPEEMPGLDCN